MGLFSRKRSHTDAADTDVDETDEERDADPVDAVTAGADVAVDATDTDTDGGTDGDDDDADPEDDELEAVAVTADDDEAAVVAGDGDEEAAADGAVADADDDPDDPDSADADHEELVDTGQVEFELADWGARERQLLDGELASARVRRAWEASTLVVRASDADVVDDLIDYIEERIALDLSPDVQPVIYEVGDWPPGLEERFLELLIEHRIPHMRGYREITVGVDDEERVDELVEQVTAAWEDEQPTEDELDGPDAQEVLSELFVSSDRLLHDPSDRPATVRFDDAAESALAMSLPFGFDEAGWGAITDLVVVLRDTLGETDSTDDEVVDAATALRSHIRPLV